MSADQQLQAAAKYYTISSYCSAFVPMWLSGSSVVDSSTERMKVKSEKESLPLHLSLIFRNFERDWDQVLLLLRDGCQDLD